MRTQLTCTAWKMPMTCCSCLVEFSLMNVQLMFQLTTGVCVCVSNHLHLPPLCGSLLWLYKQNNTIKNTSKARGFVISIFMTNRCRSLVFLTCSSKNGQTYTNLLSFTYLYISNVYNKERSIFKSSKHHHDPPCTCVGYASPVRTIRVMSHLVKDWTSHCRPIACKNIPKKKLIGGFNTEKY